MCDARIGPSHTSLLKEPPLSGHFASIGFAAIIGFENYAIQQNVAVQLQMAINKGDMRKLPKPEFMNWLLRDCSVSVNGHPCSCYLLEWTVDDRILDEWSTHVRRHYIRDDDLAHLSSFLGVSKVDYLRRHTIPQYRCKDRGGPRIVPGDFAEILVADILQFVENYTVPRYKHVSRSNPYASEQGSDVIAYRFAKGPNCPSSADELIVMEVKSAVSGRSERAVGKRISEAIGGSVKDRDKVRDAMTLNYLMERSYIEGDITTANELKRFLNRGDHPWVDSFRSAVTFDTIALGSDEIEIEDLPADFPEIPLTLIKARDFLTLVKDVYARCVT